MCAPAPLLLFWRQPTSLRTHDFLSHHTPRTNSQTRFASLHRMRNILNIPPIPRFAPQNPRDGAVPAPVLFLPYMSIARKKRKSLCPPPRKLVVSTGDLTTAVRPPASLEVKEPRDGFWALRRGMGTRLWEAAIVGLVEGAFVGNGVAGWNGDPAKVEITTPPAFPVQTVWDYRISPLHPQFTTWYSALSTT